MKLADLREKRRGQVLRQAQLARSTLREQRSDVARIVSSWNRIAKRVNAAIGRYEKATEDLGLEMPERLQVGDLLGCLKECGGEYQAGPLDEVDATIRGHVRELKHAAAVSDKLRARRVAKRRKKKA